MIVLLGALTQVADFMTTQFLVSIYGVGEWNPFMAAIMAQGMSVFLVYKLTAAVLWVPLVAAKHEFAAAIYFFTRLRDPAADGLLWLVIVATATPVVTNLYMIGVYLGKLPLLFYV